MYFVHSTKLLGKSGIIIWPLALLTKVDDVAVSALFSGLTVSDVNSVSVSLTDAAIDSWVEFSLDLPHPSREKLIKIGTNKVKIFFASWQYSPR